MYNNKKKSKYGIAIVIIILIAIVIISNTNLNNLSYAQNALNLIVMPVQNGLTYLKNKISGNNTFFININRLKQENESLKEENSKIKEQLRELEIVKSENATLVEYVNLKDKYTEYTTVPAYVVNRDISNFSENIIINVGSKDGIKENMPVISEQGLVGYVISVSVSTSKVQTIVDTSSSISCVLTSTKDAIVAKGTLEGNYLLRATYIPTDANLMEGDTVETSGIGGIYPKGILIGTIKKVVNTKNITDRYATIETATNFAKLGTVLVITNQ